MSYLDKCGRIYHDYDEYMNIDQDDLCEEVLEAEFQLEGSMKAMQRNQTNKLKMTLKAIFD